MDRRMAAPRQVPQTSQSTASSQLPSGSVPSISLPKGGGAISGMGENFSVNPATGTASLSLPISTSPGRGGMEPNLSLSYNSGSGNGPFGLGWSLNLPSITRKTDKGIPRYRDSDVFVLTDDLVALYKRDDKGAILYDQLTGEPVIEEEERDGYLIHKYSPRVEDAFLRIERWTKVAAPDLGHIHWRTITPANVTSLYGVSDDSRIYNPNVKGDQCIYSWLIAETYDTHGNAMIFKYKSEDSDGVCIKQPHEKNRTDKSRSANRYLQAIKYGNKTPNRDLTSWKPFSAFDLPSNDWLFTVAFDYGEYNAAFPKLDEVGPWLSREDPFSTYRSGFEIRTYRLCRRILMFHHFSELARNDYLVTSTDLIYDHNPSNTYLTSVTHVGYLLDENGSGYRTKSLPPVQFDYSRFPSDHELSTLRIQEVDSSSLENVPSGVDGLRYQWLDLNGEGLSGILTEQATGWFYKNNSSANNQFQPDDSEVITVAKFGSTKMIFPKPSLPLTSGRGFFADVKGDGLMGLVCMDNRASGFYNRDKSGWRSFREFKSFPKINEGTREMRFIDLTGDGLPDILITEDHAFSWHPSLGVDGYGKGIRKAQLLDEEKGPNLVFSDPEQTIYLADMSGDGLTDLVRIRNGEICYWPNTGYASFGAKVTMDNSPRFAKYNEFNQANIRVADIDGSGTSDIIYISPAGVDIYLNQTGNGFSNQKRLSIFPLIDSFCTIDVLDLLGTGTTCLVWSSISSTNMKYLDLTNAIKPHLLIKKTNNMGEETRIHYAPSTKFYLDDKQAGRHWITRLPFPVQCVEKVETFDLVSGNLLVNRYAYHHGYFDGYEREYRGFAMVEQWDTEHFDTMSSESYFKEKSISNLDATWHVPPVHTKTWFHTGAFLEGEKFTLLLAKEYFGAPSSSEHEAHDKFLDTLLDDSFIPPSLNYQKQREACRALTGHVLRQEIYSQDGSQKANIPYTVTDTNYTVRILQNEKAIDRYSVITVLPRESISFNFERNPKDPLTNHTLVLQVDEYNNILKQVDVAYGRARNQSTLTKADQLIQEQLLMTYSETHFTNKCDQPDDYVLPILCESVTYQLYGFDLGDDSTRFRLHDFTPDNFSSISQLTEIPYDAQGKGEEKRMIGRTRTIFRSNDLSHLLPLGNIETMTLPGESYQLAFNCDLVNKIYRRQRDDNSVEELIPDQVEMIGGKDGSSGGYVDLDSDGGWWVPSGRSYFAPDAVTAEQELAVARKQFFRVRRHTDPFLNSSIESYDSYNLLLIREVDAVGNTTGCENDYRCLKPFLITDPNGNRAQCAFDELGLVVGSAVMGKVTEEIGDSLDGFQISLTQKEIDEYFGDPKGPTAIKFLGNATTRVIYDFSCFEGAERKPVYTSTIARETHVSELMSGESKTQVSFTYYDGLGREVQNKVQAEPVEDQGPVRWITDGWAIFNNKGSPVRQYEPFFDSSHGFVFGQKIGVSPFIIYDPLERVIATINPNHTWTKSVFDSWHSEIYDENDTILLNPKTDKDIGSFMHIPEEDYLPTWFNARESGQMGREEELAAKKTLPHANTPTLTYFDPLGRPFLTIEDNGTNGKYSTRVLLDIQSHERYTLDPKDRIVVQYDYDMLGNIIHQSSMENGEQWILVDALEMQLYIWDSQMNRVQTTYDFLRRPIESRLQHDGTEAIVERIIYGETQPDPELKNTRTRVVQTYDQAGIATSDDYDFKGNLLRNGRQLAEEYKATLDWALPPSLEKSVYTNTMSYDALNRPVEVMAPDNSRTRRSYNTRGLLRAIEADIPGSTSFVKNIEYNPDGKRSRIEYGNGATVHYSYHPLTRQLVKQTTVRNPHNFPDDSISPHPAGWRGRQIQNLNFTYDPVGNVTHIRDDAQQAIFFSNERVDPSNDYTYDAMYRLIMATGREHISLRNQAIGRTSSFGRCQHPHDGKALSRYVESFQYDQVGNILSIRHHGQDATHSGWTRYYEYNEPSQIEPEKVNNRLSQTRFGSLTEKYSYEGKMGKSGNMTSMPNLLALKWDHKDQLQASVRQVVQDGVPEMTWYVYDGAGERLRKVTERQSPPGQTPTRLTERIYIGGFEIYRKFNGHDDVTLERQTLHVIDDERRIALVETRTKGDEPGVPKQLIRYQFQNHASSISLELDDKARVISYEEYTPYGSTSYMAARNKTDAPKRYRYSGKEKDRENGLYYFGSRYYSPAIGRWINCDPAGGVNLYFYVDCDPVNFVDPDGAMPKQFQPMPRVSRRERRFYYGRRRVPYAGVRKVPLGRSKRTTKKHKPRHTPAQLPIRSRLREKHEPPQTPPKLSQEWSPEKYRLQKIGNELQTQLTRHSPTVTAKLRTKSHKNAKTWSSKNFYGKIPHTWSHLFPLAYHKFFAEFDIDANAPKCGIEIHSDLEKALTEAGWDKTWKRFVEDIVEMTLGKDYTLDKHNLETTWTSVAAKANEKHIDVKSMIKKTLSIMMESFGIAGFQPSPLRYKPTKRQNRSRKLLQENK